MHARAWLHTGLSQAMIQQPMNRPMRLYSPNRIVFSSLATRRGSAEALGAKLLGSRPTIAYNSLKVTL